MARFVGGHVAHDLQRMQAQMTAGANMEEAEGKKMLIYCIRRTEKGLFKKSINRWRVLAVVKSL